MKRLDWEWRLADGAMVRARLELPSKIESVWIGERLVSRSGEGGNAEGHRVALVAGGGGAYRGPGEAHVAFDSFGRIASCVLAIDGQTIPPSRSPTQIRPLTIGVPSFGLLIVFALVRIAMRVPSSSHGPATTARNDPPVATDDLVPPTPASAVGPSTLASSVGPIPDADRVIAGLRPAFKKCYQDGLTEDWSAHGRVVVRVRVEDGAVLTAEPAQNSGLSPNIVTCITTAIRRAHFTGTGSLMVPVSFVQP